MRAWQADKVAEPNQRLARHCSGGQWVSPGHNGRGTTSSHAHRGRKPPLDKVNVLTGVIFSSFATAHWQGGCSFKAARGSEVTEKDQNG